MADGYETQIEIAATPETVFSYLTRPELLVRWMGDYARLDPRPEGKFEVDINGVPVRGHLLELDPPHRLVISWGHAGSSLLPPGSSRVEIRLTETPLGTLLRLEHRDLPVEEVAKHAIGWPHFLDRLATAASGSDPGSDPWANAMPGS